MFSGNTDEQNNIVASPLRAIASPFYEAVKSAQTKATRDFDRFYENLQQTLSPRTSEARIKKRTSETSEKLRSRITQKQIETESRTSLTPLFERHTLRDDARESYIARHDIESDIEDTPSLSDRDVDTPLTDMRTSRDKAPIIAPNLYERLLEERKSLDKLKAQVSKIRRQTSFLADEISSFQLNDHKDNNEPFSIASSFTPSSHKPAVEKTAYHTPVNHYQTKKMVTSPISNRFSTSPSKNTPKSNYTHTLSPSRNISSTLPTPNSFSLSPKKNTTNTSPTRNELSNAKLRSAETITTPGGTRRINRFWKEIHGLNARRESTISSNGKINKPTPISKRISNLQKSISRSQSWASDDDFWSSERNNNTSDFNQKLLQMAKDETKDLFSELESANRREEIMKRNNIPKVYPDLLAELKAKHREKFLDDSDSYKFS